MNETATRDTLQRGKVLFLSFLLCVGFGLRENMERKTHSHAMNQNAVSREEGCLLPLGRNETRKREGAHDYDAMVTHETRAERV